MSFEDKIRERISQSAVGSAERDVLKLVLGECQQEMNLTDERANNIVKKLIKSNEECLGHLPESDARFSRLQEENTVLADLLPQYLTVEQIKAQLASAGVDLSAANNDGQAMGLAMKCLKQSGLPVEGNTVKAAVAELRGS